MFDVLWTDPNRELLKERIAKRDQEGNPKGKGNKTLEGTRRSMSTHSSSSSERGFGLFIPRSRKLQGRPSSAEKPVTPQKPPIDERVRDKGDSTYGVKTLLSHPDGSEITVKPTLGPFQPVRPLDFGDAVSSVSSRDSILSKCTQPSAASVSTWASGTCVRDSILANKSEYLFQPLGPSSFVTRTTDVTSSARTPDIDIDHLISEVHISAEGEKAVTPSSEVPDDGLACYDGTQGSDSDALLRTPLTIGDTEFLMPPLRSPHTPPLTGTPNALILRKPTWQVDDGDTNREAWKPPHEWQCTPTKRGRSASPEDRLQASPTSAEVDHYMSPDIVALQREVRMMAMASEELILANIKAGMGDASDSTIYKELEMTKKRWVLSALHSTGGYAELGYVDNTIASGRSSRAPRILALYETQSSASFLAALYPQVSLAHLSQSPISPNLFPNVQPILVPTVSTSAAFRPLAPRFYTMVTCLSMPALFPATDIPPFLRQIHRCLTPGGALHLTLIDPQPVSSSMGPLLRQWMFDNLLVELEREFRTTYPNRIFPDWLRVGKLRGKGSTISTVSVPAVPKEEYPTVKEELCSLVTRMLWKEVWGSFVRAKSWWYDEEDILQECRENGTYWQYSHIVAVKDS
ncbi:hypothetical protein SLS62_007469 [Diatrype stigma]|uniref:Uncharacterized protein n=1 Tax=Diatrype stigma TaxID=117547 RepID=A0AAN9UNW7_9PEZI